MVTPEYLRSVEIFDGLTDEELAEVAESCEEIDVDKEMNLFEENSAAGFLYSLVEGNLSLRYELPGRDGKKENTVARLSPGGTCGWASMVPPFKYNVAAYCTDESCKAVRLDRDKLMAVLDANHTIGYKVMRNLARVISRRFLHLRDEVMAEYCQNIIDGW
jgi:toluene monooxygenase system ferredoxin subunit